METKPEYETKALAVQQPLTQNTWGMILEVAETVHKARLFGTARTEQAAAIMLKGYELGLPLTTSFEFIYAITVGGKTRAALSPQGHLALIMNSPLCANVEIEDIVDEQGNPWACTVTMERTNGFKYTVTVTMDDARRAGLVKPGSGWVNWPANLLRWRATGFCADVVFGDLGGGMKRTDELTNVDQEGNVIDATPAADPWPVDNVDWHDLAAKAAEEKGPQQTKVDMGFLVDNWGVELILEANGGDIPNTQKDIKDVYALLRAQYPREEVF